MYKEIELYKEPLNIYGRMPEYKNICEMSEFEQSFLCGLLKEKKPHKVLEIGVSGGGTTAVILNCLSLLGEEVEMYSVDLSDTYYRDDTLETGYVAKAAMQYIGSHVHHFLLTGKYAPEFIEDIGCDIDFLIIDTVHCLPGEILDFLAFFPFLSENAIVVLHDVALNFYGKNERAYATKILFDVVTAEKYLVKDVNRLFSIPSIAGFSINKDTKRNIQDVFSSLTITWEYLPGIKEILIYRNLYKEYYAEELINWFDETVAAQRGVVCRRYKGESFSHCIEQCEKAEKLYIYGYGTIGMMFKELFEILNINVEAYVVSDASTVPDDIRKDVPIVTLNDLKNSNSNCTVLMTIRNEEAKIRIKKELDELPFISVV